MVKQILSSIGVKAFSAIINFLVVILTAQFFGAEGRGYISLIITSISVLVILSGFIGGTNLVYLVSRHNVSGLLLTSYFWTIAVSSVAYFVSDRLQFAETEENIHVFFLSLLFSLTAVNQNILLGYQKIARSNLVTLLQVVVQILVLIYFLFVSEEKKHISMFLNSLYVSYGLAFVLSYAFLRKYILISLRTDIVRVGRIAFEYGFVAQLANLFQFTSYRFSYYILNSQFSQGTVGIYSTAVSVSEAVWLISGGITLVQYSKIAGQDDPRASQEMTLQLSKMSLVLTILAMAFLLLLPEALYVYLFGKDFAGLKLVMLTLAPGIIALGYSVVFSHYFSGRGKYYVNTIVSFLGMMITIVLNKFIVPRYGIYAAGVASSITYLAGAVLLVGYFLYESGREKGELWLSFRDVKQFKSTLQHVWNNRAD